jgi:hypothetical protein
MLGASPASAADDGGLARAARDAAPEVPFVFDGQTYVRTDGGEIVPLLDAGSEAPPTPAAPPAPKTPAPNAAPRAAKRAPANWPDRFPRDLMSAQDIAALKSAAAARPKSYNLIAWQTPIKSQGGRGTCYAFAFTAGLEGAYRHKYGRLVDGKYQGPDWLLSEEYLVHVTKSTLLNRKQIYLFENPSSYWGGVIGVTDGPMMISVLAEQMMNYRVPEAAHAPYLPLNNPPPATPAGLLQIASVSCPAVGTLFSKWIAAPPKLNASGQCVAGNCATQRDIDACEYSPAHIPPNASQFARFGVSYAFKGADGRVQPGARTLSAEQSRDTDVLESLLFAGHEIVGEFHLKWKRGPQIKTPFQTSSLWDYDATVRGDGHNMLIIGYDRTDPSPNRWYFILKNSWGGDKYYLVSYDYMRNAIRGSVVIMDVVDPRLDKPVSLVRGGAWLGVWAMHRGPKSDLDGNLVIRRTFDPNVVAQPRPGAEIRLGEYSPANGSAPREIVGYLKSDRVMVFRLGPERVANATPPRQPGDKALYTWAFGGEPQRGAAAK